MKKFTIPCHFGNKRAPFDVYIGNSKGGTHPLHYQSSWLRKIRGGEIPKEVMESFEKLLALSEKNGVSFEELCVYALEAANAEKLKMSEDLKKQGEILSEFEVFKSKIRILARPTDLEILFDDKFYLIHFPFTNNSEIFQTVFLIRAAQVESFKSKFPSNFTSIDQFTEFGKIELIKVGKDTDSLYNMVSEKYGISVAEIIENSKTEL
ncbi:DUF2610 domain-containing protein [Lunatibacter salilacus]|uniref:DUF2610 domain-containing protein n=1 Tax=Lunatibacter salilacus TaxID=2483804 RepID=UPI00131E974E|nr:DUF2610 domain-containing protein [Lunatibacter salilacus]